MSHRHTQKNVVPSVSAGVSLQLLFGGLEMPALLLMFCCSLAIYCTVGNVADATPWTLLSNTTAVYSWKIGLLLLLLPLGSGSALSYLIVQRWRKLCLLRHGQLLIGSLFQVTVSQQQVTPYDMYYRFSFRFDTPEGGTAEVSWETNHPPRSWQSYLTPDESKGLPPLLTEVLYNSQLPQTAMLLVEIFPRKKAIFNAAQSVISPSVSHG